MYLVDDSGKPYVALFSVQYTPRYSDYPRRPHDVCFNSLGTQRPRRRFRSALLIWRHLSRGPCLA